MVIIEKKIKSLDVNHDGHPDLPQLLQHFEDAAKAIEPVLAKFQPADINVALEAINHALGDKLNPAEITLVEQCLASVGQGLTLFEKMAAELSSSSKQTS